MRPSTCSQGVLLGRMADIGLVQQDQANWIAITEDVVGTSEIEGDRLDEAVVRSSVARRLGIEHGAMWLTSWPGSRNHPRTIR